MFFLLSALKVLISSDMGRSTFAIKGLMSPFDYLEEWYLTIPPNQSLEVLNPDFKLVLFLEGEVALSISGHPEIQLAKGDAYSLSIPTTQTYRSLHPARTMRLHFLRLAFRWPASATPSFTPKTTRLKPEKQFEGALRHQLAGFHYFPHSLFGDYYPILRRILAEMENTDKTSAWKISGLCQTLTADILSTASSKTRKPGRPVLHRHRDTIITSTLQYLQENCHDILTLDNIAWQMQLSGEHLARLFKQSTDRTVFSWLDHFRTEKARNLLATTEWPLARIARACGYSSANLLSRHFRKNIGCPPITYRVKIRKGETFSPSKLSKPSTDLKSF